MKHEFAEVNGIRLHYVEAGSGPPVLLLHGFPDFWYSWREQIPALAAAGYRVIAIDLRGYGRSEVPPGVRAYAVEALAADVVGVAAAMGQDRPVVVGHDWGGLIGWHLAMHSPEHLRGLVVLNAPHPLAFRRELRRPSTQPLRSLYAAFFQLPMLPEAILSAGDFALLKRALRMGPARSAGEQSEYLSALADRRRLTAALNYYRALLRHPPAEPRRIDLPTLLMWGDRDPFLVPELARGLDPWVRDLELVPFDQGGHWLHLAEPERVNQRLIDFLRRLDRREAAGL